MTRLRIPYVISAFLAAAALSLIFTTGCRRDSYTAPQRYYDASCRSYLTTAEQLQECVRKSLDESSNKQPSVGLQPAPSWTPPALLMPTHEPVEEDDSVIITASVPGSNNNSVILPKNAAAGREPDKLTPKKRSMREGAYTLEGTISEGRLSIRATFERGEDIFRRGKEKCTLSLDITEHAPEGYVNARVTRYEDAGCDGRVETLWDDKIISRNAGNEAYFTGRIDPAYRRWTEFVGA